MTILDYRKGAYFNQNPNWVHISGIPYISIYCLQLCRMFYFSGVPSYSVFQVFHNFQVFRFVKRFRIFNLFRFSVSFMLCSACTPSSVLHGVVSWGVACDPTDNFGGVFANVFNMIGFIRDVLVRICASCLSNIVNLQTATPPSYNYYLLLKWFWPKFSFFNTHYSTDCDLIF